MSTTLIAPSQVESNVPFQENKLIFIWSVVTLLVVMNTTMFNVALPFILVDLSISSSTASWLVSSYSVTFAISTLTFSRLSDIYPLSRLLLMGVTLLGIASIIGFFSTHFFVLLAVRVLQAFGAGAVMGLHMIMAGRYIPLSRRGKAMAIIASVASLGFGLGPVIGGVIVEYLGWNYLFAVTAFTIFSIPFFVKLLPKEEVKEGHFDLYGAILMSLFVAGILLFMSTFSYSILLGTIVLFVILWKYLHKIEDPFIPPDLVKNKQFTKLLLIGCSAFFINFSTLFLMPILLTAVFAKSSIVVGMHIFPGAIIAVIAGHLIGRFIDRFGNRGIIVIGQILLLFATILFAWLSTLTPYAILFIYMFASVGFTALSSSIPNEVTRILPTNEISSGLGMVQLLQLFGGGIGVIVSGILLSSQEALSMEVMYRNIFSCLGLVMVISIVIYGFYRKQDRVRETS